MDLISHQSIIALRLSRDDAAWTVPGRLVMSDMLFGGATGNG